MSTVYMDKNSVLCTTPSVDRHSKSTPPIVPIESGAIDEDSFNRFNENLEIEKMVRYMASGTIAMLTSSRRYTEEDIKEITSLVEKEYPELIKSLAGKPPIYITEKTNKMVQRTIIKYDKSRE